MKHIAASALYVALDGAAFAMSGGGLLMACSIAAMTVFAENPSRFSRIALRSTGLVVVGRIGYSLFQLFRPRQSGKTPEDPPLESIWDWAPPETERAQAWFVLKELVATFHTISEEYPQIKELVDGTSDLAQRIWYYLVTNTDDIGQTEIRPAQAHVQLSDDDERALALLRAYREYCLYSYDCTSDQELEARLLRGEFTLIGAKFVSDELSPAFFLAYRQKTRETMMCLRGTYSGNDIITDLVAAGMPFEDGYAHAGMAQKVEYLSRRFQDFLLSAARDGVVTVCGHSLGAGVASLLTHKLRKLCGETARDNIRCLCYEPPACMSSTLADSSAEFVFSLVNRDDLVPRLGPTPIINLLHELQSFDWKSAAENDGNSMVRRITMLFAGNQHDEMSSDKRARPTVASDYDPLVPGRIFFISPGSKPVRVDRFGEELRRLKLTSTMIMDHFIDSDEFREALYDLPHEI